MQWRSGCASGLGSTLLKFLVGFFSLLCGLAVLVVCHLHPLTARPSPQFTLAGVAVSVTAAHHLLWRGRGWKQMKSCGNNLALLRAAGWATWFGREVGALARVRQLDPCPASCLQRVGVRMFLGKQPKQGLRRQKRERKLHLLQFAQVSVGDTIIPTHWASLPMRQISQMISKEECISKMISWLHTFPGQLILLQVLILSRHFFSGTW